MSTIIVTRHGEVHNPNHVVYADLPGFDLSPAGVLQAAAVSSHLADHDIGIVLSSPLARARHTATAIARHHGLEVHIDERLTETRMYPHWTGMRWDDVRTRFPDQFDRYLTDASALDDVTESVFDVAARVTGAVADARSAGYDTIVAVGHQDPSQILRLSMTGQPLSGLRTNPPGHASATILTADSTGTFVEVSRWEPEITLL